MRERIINDISPMVAAICGLMVAVELVFQAAGAGMLGGAQGMGWRLAAVQDYGVPGALWDLMWERGEWPAAQLLRYVIYPFLHGDFTQMIFTSALVLAIGKFVGDRFAGWAMAVLFLVCSGVGAVAWSVLSDDQSWLIGAFPAAYGFIGAFTYILWVSAKAVGASQWSAFQLIGMLMVIRLILGLILGPDTRWIAEVAGFVTGFGLSFVLSPGGFARLREMVRRGHRG